jgi:predicted SAM-dependent methyltransferase
MRFSSKAGLRRRNRAAAVAVRQKAGRATAKAQLGRAKWPDRANLHLGCRPIHFDGWVNIDINKAVKPDVRVNLRFGFPAPARSVGFVFSEHVVEHSTLADGSYLFADWRLTQKPGGVMRIAMPDLRNIVNRYVGDWKAQAWLDEPTYEVIDIPARMLNFALRSWEHLCIYDVDDLTLGPNQAGFTAVAPREWPTSQYPDLTGLERRPDSLLIVEATK